MSAGANAGAGAGALPRLGAARLDPGVAAAARAWPERVLQFGEENFLRAFVDWMLHRMNARGLFGGRAVVVQPIARGAAAALAAQDGLFTVLLRGRERGCAVDSAELVTSVSRAVDPYADCDAFWACARIPELRFVVSNTTEAGIATDPRHPDERLDARPAASFPGKLTQILHERYRCFGGDPARGLVMLPCELIERNGEALRRAVEETAARWRLPEDFFRWLRAGCVFASTLVDRIVTGRPAADEARAIEARLGYRDDLLVAGEPFHLWVIETPRPLGEELPLREAGLDVVWTADLAPYRARKVRILNGAHTLLATAAFLAGKDTVRACMEDDGVRAFVEAAVRDEIAPTLAMPRAELDAFAAAVFERFANPFIQHRLLDIALNSVSKYRARLLGTVQDFRRTTGTLPPRLTFGLAALAALYRGNEIRDGALIGARGGARAGAAYAVRDEPAALEAFRAAWAEADAAAEVAPSGGAAAEAARAVARRILPRADLWGADLAATLPDLEAAVAGHLAAILELGAARALARLA